MARGYVSGADVDLDTQAHNARSTSRDSHSHKAFGACRLRGGYRVTIM